MTVDPFGFPGFKIGSGSLTGQGIMPFTWATAHSLLSHHSWFILMITLSNNLVGPSDLLIGMLLNKHLSDLYKYLISLLRFTNWFLVLPLNYNYIFIDLISSVPPTDLYNFRILSDPSLSVSLGFVMSLPLLAMIYRCKSQIICTLFSSWYIFGFRLCSSFGL